MVDYKIASQADMELLLQSRLEMLRVVNGLPADHVFPEEFIKASREYFARAPQTTILALENGVVGCATLCYLELLPTFSHPTGKRAHLMNVYVTSEYRRQGIARQMLTMLLDEAGKRGVTEISLDATQMGRPLYERFGFTATEEGMTLVLSQNA